MNPNENNPMAPTGDMGTTGGATSTPGGLGATGAADMTAGGYSPVMDFTDSGNVDGAAAAQPGIDGLPQQPTQPLVPAEPVPGSIGSVTSVPPLAPEPMDATGLAGNTAPVTSNMPVMGQATENKPANNGAPYYNPFMRNEMPNTAAKSAEMPKTEAVAPAVTPMQAKMNEAMNGKKLAGEKKPGNVMALLGWLLAMLFAVVAVVMGVLWMSEKNKDPKIVYIPTPVENEEEDDELLEDGNGEPVAEVTTLKCTQESGGNADEMPGLVTMTGEVLANYGQDGLTDISMTAGYVFTDTDAATAAKPTVDLVNAMFDMVEVGAGFSHGVSQIDNVVSFGLSATADVIANDQSVSDMLYVPMAEDGSKDTSVETLRGAYEAQGFVCE